MIVTPKSETITLTGTLDTVSNASHVLLTNQTASAVIVTLYTEANTAAVKGSLPVAAGASQILFKAPFDSINVSANIYATAVTARY